MAESNTKVLFKFGSRAEYESLSPMQIQNNALYFLTDTNELYRGSVPMCKSHYYEGEVQEEETVLHAQARILDEAIPVANDILVLCYENGNRIPYIYTEDAGWKLLINVVVEGSTPVEAGMDYDALDEDVFSTIEENNETVGFTLKDFGVKYYDYVDGNYVLVTVDDQHPWPTGLTPRVTLENGRPVLGWFMPNPDTGAGQAEDLTALKQDVADLKLVVGHAGTGSSPATGLVQKVGSLVEKVKIGSTTLTPVDGTLELSIFDGTNNGLVPKPSGISGIKVLGSNGYWLDPNDFFELEWKPITES